MKYSIIFLSLLTAGALDAQTPAPAPAPALPAAQTRAHAWRDAGMARLTVGLNLTPDQKKQAHEIFSQSRTEFQALAPKLRDDRAAMAAAVKSDSEDRIDQVAKQDAQLRTQAEEIHAKTLAKFYAILTPDQRAKVDQRMDRMLGYFPHREGKRSTAGA